MLDAHVNAHHRRSPAAHRNHPLDLTGEGDEPAIGRPTDGRSQDAGSALLQATGEFARGLVGLQHANLGELDMFTVAQHPERTGGEPTGVPRSTLPLLSWKTHRATLAATAS
jgi:hypothetical protein